MLERVIAAMTSIDLSRPKHTYLGHVKPEFTYWYIEAVPELLQLASQRAERALAVATSEGYGR